MVVAAAVTPVSADAAPRGATQPVQAAQPVPRPTSASNARTATASVAAVPTSNGRSQQQSSGARGGISRTIASAFGGLPQFAARLAALAENEMCQFAASSHIRDIGRRPRLTDAATLGRSRGGDSVLDEEPLPSKLRQLAAMLAQAADWHGDDTEIAEEMLPPLLRGILAAGSLPEPQSFIMQPFVGLVLQERFLGHTATHLCALFLATCGSVGQQQASPAYVADAVASRQRRNLDVLVPRFYPRAPPAAWVFAAGVLSKEILEAAAVRSTPMEAGIRQGMASLQWAAYFHLRWTSGLEHPRKGSLSSSPPGPPMLLAAPWPLMDGGSTDRRIRDLAAVAADGSHWQAEVAVREGGGGTASEASNGSAASESAAGARDRNTAPGGHAADADDPDWYGQDAASESCGSHGGNSSCAAGSEEYPSDLDDFVDVSPELNCYGTPVDGDRGGSPPQPSARPAPSGRLPANSARSSWHQRQRQHGQHAGRAEHKAAYRSTAAAAASRERTIDGRRDTAIHRNTGDGPRPESGRRELLWDWKDSARRVLSIHGPPPALPGDRRRPRDDGLPLPPARPRAQQEQQQLQRPSSAPATARIAVPSSARGVRSQLQGDELLDAMMRRVRRRMQ